MAARKLQTEIDRTLKKVSEGVEVFESIYEKMQASSNQTQKEKQELDLKTQIKKLQRLRDQIKTWVASNDIKDKSQLVDNRRLIETQMEKFKACEKEMKTKAFSKEGLIQAAKLDPKEQEKEEATVWLQTQVEDLQMQVEATEAEVEALQGAGKKRNKAGSTAAGRLEELETLNERRKWHISRLEIVLRLLNNGSLPTEKVWALKEDVQYFVESNTEEDFDEDEGIYDDLNLDEEEEKFRGLVPDDDDSDESDIGSDDIPPRTPSKKLDEESVTSSKRDDSPVLKKAAATLPPRKPSIDVAKPPPPNINFAQQPMASIVKASLQQPPRLTPATPIRYAAAAAAAVAPPLQPQGVNQTSVPSAGSASTPTANGLPITPTIPAVSPSIALQQQTPVDQLSGVSSSPSLTHLSVTSPMLSSASASHQPDGSFYSGQESPALSEAVPSSPNSLPAAASTQQAAAPSADLSSARAGSQSPSILQTLSAESPQIPAIQMNGATRPAETRPASPPHVPSPIQSQPQQATSSAAVPSPIPPHLVAPHQSQVVQQQLPQQQQQPQFPPGVKVLQSEQASSVASGSQHPTPSQTIGAQRPPSVPQQTAAQPRVVPPAAFPGSLSDLVVSFENVKQKAAMRMANLDQVQKMLEGSYSSVPQPQDTEKPKYYVPRNPFPTAPYYPQNLQPLLSTPAIFSQLDVETLFYVFYYLPGTYQQCLAAKELKRQSWRFHVKYLTWFQRHSEPQAITEEYEQGVYVYFDWEGSWCQRKKSDFRFEYRYLSED